MKLPPFFRKKRGGNKTTYLTWGGPIGPTGPQARESLGRLEQKTEEGPFDPRKHKDTKRAQIALIFVWGYMIIVALIVMGIPLYNWLAISQPQPLAVDTSLAQVGALIGSPLGFVVGYYFKEDKD